tara:strand:- start:690 stop:986 length:297 start_codon:yes stop_codon:yes gene_type:complete
MNIYEVKQLFFEASNAKVVVGSDPTKANQKNFYRHYTVNGTRREPPYGELTSLLAPEAEHVTSLALQKLLADLMAEQSNLSAYIFFKKPPGSTAAVYS